MSGAPRRTPTALTIAGSDSGGGAGIQADLKAFAACGVHGMCAITAITAQNTVGVTLVETVPPDVIVAQVHAVVEDLPPDAVKVGMLADEATIDAVARALDAVAPEVPIVLDPVMVAESGARLLAEDAQAALVARILPRAAVVTPNLPEARVLAGIEASPGELVRAVLALGPRSVVLTGGHRERAVDLFLDAEGEGGIVEIEGPRHPDGAAHGSGCTHSSVIAAELARGSTRLDAARAARRLAGDAIARGLRDLGGGAGPVDVIGLSRQRGR
jgi:hydroxymethylpyrimidine/phosphomethylpyrimidine kinase